MMNGPMKIYRNREHYKNGRSESTRDGENSTENSGNGKSLNLSSQIQYVFCTGYGVSQADIENYCTIQPVKL